jgi:hypothetical protein
MVTQGKENVVVCGGVWWCVVVVFLWYFCVVCDIFVWHCLIAVCCW